jgi:hypothetical protein
MILFSAWKSKIFRLLIIAFIIVLLIFAAFKFLSKSEHWAKVSFIAPPDYSDLFNDSAQEQLILKVTYLINGRNPMSNYFYKDRYSVLVYKINIPSDSTLKSIIRQDFKGANKSLTMDYTELGFHQFKLSYAGDSVPEAKNVLVTFYGDSVAKIFKNDSVNSVYIVLNRIIIRYEANEGPDIIAEKLNAFKDNTPMILIFVKRKSSLYFIFVSNIDNNYPLDRRLPFKLLKTNS